MSSNDLDKKYFSIYLELLEKISKGLGVELNTELDDNGAFVDKRLGFGYAVFTIERKRVEQISKEIEEVAYKGFDEMYELGRQSVIQGGYRE